MARELILETTYLVDLEREVQRADPGPAMMCLEREANSILSITFTVAGEMAAGTSLGERSAWDEFLSPFRILGCTADICWEYGELYRDLRGRGALIGTNDLWIAATALVHGMPVVTRNAAHFGRIVGLEVLRYR